MSEFKDWFNSVPFFTRYWLSLTIGLSLLGRFGLLNMYHLMLDFPSIFYSFQVCIHGTLTLLLGNIYILELSFVQQVTEKITVVLPSVTS